MPVMALAFVMAAGCNRGDQGPLGIGVTFKDGPGLPTDVASLTVTVTPYASTASTCAPNAGPVSGEFPREEMTDLDSNGFVEAVLHDLPYGCPLYVEVLAYDASAALRYSGRADGIVLIQGERRFVEMDLTPENSISLLGSTLEVPSFALTATQLSETDGRVLLTGGFTSATSVACPTGFEAAEYSCFDLAATDRAYVFDQGSARVIPVASGNMTVPRALHSATLLADGRVLIAGGVRSATLILRDDSAAATWAGYEIVDVMPAAGAVLSSYELFDPEAGAETADPARDGDLARGAFVGDATNRLNYARYAHASALMTSDASSVDSLRVFLAGGFGPAGIADTSVPLSVDVFSMDLTGVHDFLDPGFPQSFYLRPAPTAAFVGGAAYLFGGATFPGSIADPADPNVTVVEKWLPTTDGLEWNVGTVSFNEFDTTARPEMVRLFAHALPMGNADNTVAVTGWYGARCDDTQTPGTPTPTFEYLESDEVTEIPTYICPPDVTPDFTLTTDITPPALVADTTPTSTPHALAATVALQGGTRAGQVLIMGGISDVGFTTTDAVDVYQSVEVTGELTHDAALALALNNQRAMGAAAEMNGGNVVVAGGAQFDLAAGTITVLDTVEYLNW